MGRGSGCGRLLGVLDERGGNERRGECSGRGGGIDEGFVSLLLGVAGTACIINSDKRDK